MPLIRVSNELHKKIQAIMKKTGWKSIGFTLDRLLENITAEDFFSYESEVIIRIRKGED